MKQFDLIVIGSGPAASTVASSISASDKHVAIIESRTFGGTCALRGCNPKKVYTNAANLVEQTRSMNGKLANFPNASIDWNQLYQFQRTFVEPIELESERSYRDKGIDTYHGIAKFADSNRIIVDGETLTAKRIFIATGARPRELGFNGAEHAMDSAQFLDRADLPREICFIGGGYVSMEFGCVAKSFGSEVTVFQRGDSILKTFDQDLVKHLSEQLKQNGMNLQLKAEVKSIEKVGNRFRVDYEQQGQQCQLETDLVIHGAGRAANIDALELDKANVEFTERGIVIDEHNRTSNPQIFAAGDCADNGKPMLTTTANEEARIVVKNLFAENLEKKPDYGKIARVAFTTPPIAAVGMSHSEAEQACHDLEIKHQKIDGWSSVRKSWQTCASYKILIDKPSGQILGAHLLGPNADETINLFALAMKFELAASDIKSTLFAFPTFAHGVRNMV